jgi:hypothetical protein
MWGHEVSILIAILKDNDESDLEVGKLADILTPAYDAQFIPKSDSQDLEILKQLQLGQNVVAEFTDPMAVMVMLVRCDQQKYNVRTFLLSSL